MMHSPYLRSATETSKWLILPTKEIRDLFIRAVESGRTKWNYAITWNDVNGFGLHLAIADWCTKANHIYID